jgi:hypothetical protein
LRDHINCNYRGSSAHNICNWAQIICNQPANIRMDPHWVYSNKGT